MKKKFFIGLFIFLIIAFAVFAHLMLKHKDGGESSTQTNIQAPIEIPDTGIVKYQEAKFKKPVVVMFYVDWCTFCRRFMPIFGEAAKKYSDKFEFAVLNCEYPENNEIVKEFEIAGYPSIFIIDKDLDFQYQPSISSTQSIEAFSKELDKHLKLRKKLKK